MTFDLSAVPVTGAVHRHLDDRVVGHVGADHLPAIPVLALMVPPLLELDREPGVGLAEPLDANLSREGMTAGTDRDGVPVGVGLHPPLR